MDVLKFVYLTNIDMEQYIYFIAAVFDLVKEITANLTEQIKHLNEQFNPK